MSWQEMAQADPDLAAFGADRLQSGIAYLATIRESGAPRVHPVTPILGEGRLFVFMEPTSPKGHDLQRDGRYALHSAVRDTEGSNGEFIVTGKARLVSDPQTRAVAAAASTYAPRERYILFELGMDSATSTVYAEGGAPVRRHWKRGTP